MERLKGIKEKQRKETIAYAVAGGIIIAAILLITMSWMSNKARTGTNLAVSRVSDFYLEELAGRRAQVVSEELNTHLNYIENALTVLEDSDLESQETLQEFLGKVKKLYGVDMFALVDENGIIYTEQGTSSVLNGYEFLAEELTEPVINTTNLEGDRKQAVIASPVDNVFFQGARIRVCFVQINIDEMLSSLSLQANGNETYCSLYHRNGEDLSNNDFGNLETGTNLLSVLLDADISAGYSYEQVKDDFTNGRAGEVTFTYRGFQETLSYLPVDGTNWMMTILIRDNVISEQISSISSDMMLRGVVQIVITVLVMLVMFLVLIRQAKRNAGVLLEQEKKDGDRIRAAYAQIEKEQVAMDNIHAAMGSGHWSMEFNEKAEIVSCTWSDVFRKMVGYENEEDFPNRLESWSDLLDEEDKPGVLKEYWETVKDYTGEKTYDVEYRIHTKHNGCRWFHAAGRLSRRKDGSPIDFVGLFVDIDDEKKMEAQLEKQKADLEDALAAAQHANRAKTTFLNNMSHDI
ncbi:MAG: PAS domain-containing protein, partial [Lachnospiraceae bacterium]|nr:PAS domain-containing protein [Lachnospiraceae bacterium]